MAGDLKLRISFGPSWFYRASVQVPKPAGVAAGVVPLSVLVEGRAQGEVQYWRAALEHSFFLPSL